MPYASHEARQRVQREAQARRRAAHREAAAPTGVDRGGVNPVPPPPTPPTLTALHHIGAMLGEGSLLRNETPAQYHERLRSKVKTIRHVLEE